MEVPNHKTKREHFLPPIPTYQSNIRSNDVDDDRTWKNDGSDCEIEFQTQHQIADHCLGSPPRWTRRASRRITTGAFPSFPLQYHYNNFPSPTRLLQESRKSLMRMVEDMPESSYELSLRDMVKDQQSMEEAQQEGVKEDGDNNNKDESKSKFDSKKKRQYKNKGQISRMDSRVFLLNIFNPKSLSSKEKTCPKASPKQSPGSKRHSKEKTCPKASPKQSPERAENRNGLWRSTSDISWSTQRPFTSYFRVASWSSNTKPRQRGCLF